MLPHEELEEKFGSWLQVPNVVACSSGTAALHLALESLKLPPGEVILCDYNMVACARAVALAGLRPVFVDCDEKLLIDPDLVADAVTKDTVAIIATHVYGRRCDMAAINQIADKHQVCVVEDLAEAHGVKPHPQTDAACWSFYRNKVVAGEEGGAVSFLSEAAAKLARSLRTLGFTDAHDYTHRPRGHNYRMSSLHASAVLESLRYVKSSLHYRRLVESWYDAGCPSEWKQPQRDVVWVYDVRIPGLTAQKQASVVANLRRRGVEARYGFKPMTTLAEFLEEPSPNIRARSAAREVIYLPVTGRTSRLEVSSTMSLLKELLNA